eukprot:CAMPEP_0196804830 /NCGR_PEP_ID=MMETSP1362-20130617/4507_1 /TAXON_ID=163516 /ORGANISM="Leptocylindrus danicus, Strain CCMP1856" /LENGTH=496 /DNA_ID=CAMNT_0042177359 /DNA_START=321 /DNA_END=1811 /DNA_ORIENTATION=-
MVLLQSAGTEFGPAGIIEAPEGVDLFNDTIGKYDEKQPEATGTAASTGCSNYDDGDISDLSSSDDQESYSDESDVSSSTTETDPLVAKTSEVVLHGKSLYSPGESKVGIYADDGDDDDYSSSLEGDNSSEDEEAFMLERALMSQDWKSAKLAIQSSKSNDDEVIHSAANASAAVLSRKEDDSNILLELLVSADWQKAKVFIQSKPNSAQKRDGKGRLPLYLACTNKDAPDEIIEALMTAYPKALEVKFEGKLPIHAVISAKCSNTSFGVVKNMIKFYPLSTSIPDDAYMLPIHRACCYGVRDVVINALYQSNKRAIIENKNMRHSKSLDKGMRATIFGSIGNVHVDNGDYDLACDSYSISLLLKREVYGNDHAIVAQALTKLSIAHRKLGKLSTAKVYLEESLSILDRVANDSDPELGDTMVQMGKIFSKERHFNRAHKYFINACKVYRSAKIPPEDPRQCNLRQLLRQNFANAIKSARASRERQSSRGQSFAVIG